MGLLFFGERGPCNDPQGRIYRVGLRGDQLIDVDIQLFRDPDKGHQSWFPLAADVSTHGGPRHPNSCRELQLRHVAFSEERRQTPREVRASIHEPNVTTSVTLAVAHIACSAAAIRVTTTAGMLTDSGNQAAALVQRALSASLFFGGLALSYERLLEKLGI